MAVGKRYEKDSSKVGKASFAFAWVLDETGEERNRYLYLRLYLYSFSDDIQGYNDGCRSTHICY